MVPPIHFQPRMEVCVLSQAVANCCIQPRLVGGDTKRFTTTTNFTVWNCCVCMADRFTKINVKCDSIYNP